MFAGTRQGPECHRFRPAFCQTITMPASISKPLVSPRERSGETTSAALRPSINAKMAWCAAAEDLPSKAARKNAHESGDVAAHMRADMLWPRTRARVSWPSANRVTSAPDNTSSPLGVSPGPSPSRSAAALSNSAASFDASPAFSAVAPARARRASAVCGSAAEKVACIKLSGGASRSACRTTCRRCPGAKLTGADCHGGACQIFAVEMSRFTGAPGSHCGGLDTCVNSALSGPSPMLASPMQMNSSPARM